MSFTMLFTPAAVLAVLLAAVLLVRGLRSRSWSVCLCAGGLFGLTGLCVCLVMEFITRGI